MKLPAILFAAAVLAAPAVAFADPCEGDASPATGVLSVDVTKYEPLRGQVTVTVYPNDKTRFLAPKGKLERQRVKIAGPVTRSCFNLPAGTYAVVVYHDANSDGDFNRNLAGLPKEGFGFSNDAPTRLGLPPLDEVRFRFTPGDPPIRVSMRYLNR
jgi:uncharacterized protein (DUF2141 family)